MQHMQVFQILEGFIGIVLEATGANDGVMPKVCNIGNLGILNILEVDQSNSTNKEKCWINVIALKNRTFKSIKKKEISTLFSRYTPKI